MTVEQLIKKLEGMDKTLEVTVSFDVPGVEISVDDVQVIESEYSWRDKVVEISV